jgi:eukaryotic-like serine/threonine-protein kinase
MPESSETIAYCHSCGSPMNVEAVAPFSNVGCPVCGKHTRVKREFGPYTLVRRHAVGGMSMVFAALDTTLDREVALKILSEDFSSDEKRIAAFEEEARITASFSHPNVVRVLTTGKAFGRLYIAMELVPGGHFEHQIQERGKIPEIEMLPLAIEIAHGLKAAHAAGLIHRDVKPGNILLDAEGHAKLVDFGLALVTQGGKAKAAEIWATPYYVPPETIEGAVEDFRSDIYAFGATLYHALAGKPSCGEETMSTNILREAKKKVVPMSLAEPSLSEETCRIIERAMAYEPQDRYGSYDEMIARLEVALKRLASGRPRESSGSAAKRRAKTKQGEILAFAAAGVVLLGALSGGIWWVTRKPPEQQVPKPLAAATLPPVTTSGTTDSTEIAKNYREAHQAVEAGDFEKAAIAFVKLRENPAVQEPTRTWAGVEAVVASFLDGKPSEARRHAVMVGDHIRLLPESGRIDPGLVEMLDAVRELPPVLSAAPASASGAPRIMSCLLAGLKNWEQGMISESVPWFRAAASAGISADEEWLKIYQKTADVYLTDSRLLADPVFGKFPEDAAGCGKAIETLDTIHASLKTRGRARFNVRAWQLDLARQAKLLAAPKPEVPRPTPPLPAARPELAEVMATLGGFAAKCDFTKASVYLKSLGTDPQGATRTSLLSVTESAGVFLEDLETDLATGPLDAEILMKSGTRGRRIRSESGKLFITDSGGIEQATTWSEIAPDTFITLHRMLVKNSKTEIERLRRHQCAIAFDWLAGNRERALLAANVLCESSLSFRQVWGKTAAGLPE